MHGKQFFSEKQIRKSYGITDAKAWAKEQLRGLAAKVKKEIEKQGWDATISLL